MESWLTSFWTYEVFFYDCALLILDISAAMSFTPEEIGAEIRKHIPEFQLTYNIDPMRQNIGKLVLI